jgi:hypothetical protein
MKVLSAGMFAALLLSGCASSIRTPTRLADGASGGLWTSQPASEVQACIDRITAANPNGATRFSVASNDPEKVVYATTVSIFAEIQDQNPVVERVVIECTGTRPTAVNMPGLITS